jgi:hypothetical protein
MKAERWQQIEHLFHAAVARGADGRAAFLDKACAGDATLRVEVEALLASHEEAGSFMNTPVYLAREVKTGGKFESGPPAPLFKVAPSGDYDVSADGQRFLVTTGVTGSQSSPFNVVLNWTATLRR